MRDVDKACANYLRQTEDTKRIMKGLLNKYLSRAEVMGNFVLHNPTKGERLFLRGLFKKDVSEQKQISISLKKFEEAFLKTRFTDMSLSGVLEAYFGEELISNKEVYNQKIQAREAFFERVFAVYREENLIKWLKVSLEDKTGGCYKWLMSYYNENPMGLCNSLLRIQDITNLIENSKEPMLLPVIAAIVTKDPHGLDEGMELKKGLLYYLSFKYIVKEINSAQDRANLLKKSGILDDAGNRLVYTYGLKATDSAGDSLGWEAFHHRKEPLILNLLNLNGIKKIETCLKGKELSKIYCFENSAVFYTIIKQCPWISAICTGGQMNLCVYELLDYLYDNYMVIYYHGDFDPEGLLIADKLKLRYEKLELFCYREEDYKKCLSDKKISSKRLAQLLSVKNEGLLPIARLMEEYKLAGYEEYMMEELIKVVKDFSEQ